MKQIELSDAIIAKLKYVEISRKGTDISRFPTFLIVGPQRTGTTWLSQNLEQHPEIFMARPKEIYFFNTLTNQDHKYYRSSKLDWYLHFFKDSPLTYIAKTMRCLRGYSTLYNPRVRGEATASYAVLDRDVIEDIVTLNPNMKVIFMVRNPIDRAWSHAKKDLMQRPGEKLHEVPPIKFEKFFIDEYQDKCGRYMENIERWSSILREYNLFVGIFDDIKKEPEKLLRQLYEFLEVKSDIQFVPSSAKRRVNTTPSDDLPVHYRNILRDIFKEEIDRLNSVYGLEWK